MSTRPNVLSVSTWPMFQGPKYRKRSGAASSTLNPTPTKHNSSSLAMWRHSPVNGGIKKTHRRTCSKNITTDMFNVSFHILLLYISITLTLSISIYLCRPACGICKYINRIIIL